MADLDIPVGYGHMQFSMVHATIAHTAICTLGFEILTPPWTQANNDLALADFRASISPLHDAEVTYARLVTLVGNDGPLLRFDSAGTTGGARTTQVITSPNVSYLMRKNTTFAGRRYRGRMYIPFVATNGLTQTGQLTSAELTLLTTAAAALKAALVETANNIASLRVLHSSSPLSVTPAPTPISTLSAESFVATQRRRLERS